MAPVINRIHLTDDTGAGEDGTVLDDALFQTLQDNIDGLSGAIIAAVPTPAQVAQNTTNIAANTSAIAAANAANNCLLLHAIDGSFAGSGTAQVDVVTLGVLTRLDAIEILFQIQGGATAGTVARVITESAEILCNLAPALTVNQIVQGRILIKPAQASMTFRGVNCEALTYPSGGRIDSFSWLSVARSWLTTGGVVQLQLASVPAGSPVNWSWAVYKRLGQ